MEGMTPPVAHHPKETAMSAASTAAGSQASQTVLEPEVVKDTTVNQNLLSRLLGRAGRTVARPALECFEMLLDGATPHQARLTALAALTYLVLPTDLIPDFIPAAGFADDMVALTALLGLCSRHITPQIKARAQRKLDLWFPKA
jgi:uncharacterized membrane protein YkvA (DUF1232 family)